MLKKFLSLLLIGVMLLSFCSCTAKKAEFSHFDGVFSPFFALQAPDLSVVDMTQASLLTTYGEDAERILNAASEGIGIANIEMDTTTEDSLVCTISISPNAQFSDGEKITADDLIFSMYVYADTDYEGWASLASSTIKGLKAYRYGSAYTDDVEFTSEQLAAELESGDADSIVIEKVIEPVLKSELEWITESYADEGYKGTELEQYMEKYTEPKDLYAFLFSIDESYDSSKVSDAQQVFEDIKAQYGADYKTLATVLGVDLSASAELCARDSLAKKLGEQQGGTEVKTIEGIEKVDEQTVKVTFYGQEGNGVDNALNIYVAPLHYYGDESLYDYENASFGFVKGDLSKIREKNGAPLGAGEYVMTGYEADKGVSFSKNKKYFRQTDTPSKVYFVETHNSSADKSHGYFVSADNISYVEK